MAIRLPVDRLPLDNLAVARHRITKEEITECCEQIGFHDEPGPGWLREGNFDRRQKVEKADDDNEGSVLEKADEGIDQRRNCYPQRLRQDDVGGPLRITQSESLGCFFLLARYGLESAAHHLSEISGGKKNHRELGAQELVDGYPGRQKKRQHNRSHKQNGYYRNAADQLDVGDGEPT